MNKKSNHLIYMLLLYIPMIAMICIVFIAPRKIFSERIPDKFQLEIDSIHQEYKIVQLNIEMDSLVDEMKRLRYEMDYDSSYLIQSQYHTTRKNAELKNLELKEAESISIQRSPSSILFYYLIFFVLILMPILAFMKIWQKMRISRFYNQTRVITPNEIADVITYSVGPIIFVLIFF